MEQQRKAQLETRKQALQQELARKQKELATTQQRAAQHKRGFVPTDKGRPTVAVTGSAPATVDGRASFQGPGIQRSGNAVLTKPVPLSPSTAQDAQRRQAEAAARQRAEQQRMGGPMATDKRLSTGGFSTITAGSTPATIGGQSTFHAPTMQKAAQGSEKLLEGVEKASESKAVQAISSGARLAKDLVTPSNWDKVGQDAREAKNKTKDAVVGGVDAVANAMTDAITGGFDPAKSNARFKSCMKLTGAAKTDCLKAESQRSQQESARIEQGLKATNFMDNPTMQKVVQGNEKAWKGVDKIADKTVEGAEKVSESKTIQAISSGARLAKDMRSLSSLDKVGQGVREAKGKTTDALGR